MSQCWCNNQWLALDELPLDPMDRGVTLGLGLFETLLAIDGEPQWVDRHLARLEKSSQRLGWNVPTAGMNEVIREILVRNSLTRGRARIRLTVTAGKGAFDDLALDPTALRWITAMPVADSPHEISASICPWTRNERSAMAGMKSTSYAENLVALDHARRLGFQDTIFLNTAGQLCEAATSNLFLVKDGVLLTPSLESGCLPGIAREVVLELAERCGITSREQVLTLEDLHSADEVFLTSSIRGITVVLRVEDQVFSNSEVTARLREGWGSAQ